MDKESELDKIVFIFTLKNAIKHNGKAMVKSVVSSIVAENPELKKNAREIAKLARVYVDKVNSLGLDKQKEELAGLGVVLEEKKEAVRGEKKQLPPLPNAVEGSVVTRFAPNPDFVIHIGNARPAILSYEYARLYKGKMILRFEDTDPRTKTPLIDAYELIREDLKWLGVVPDEEYVQSRRLEIYYGIVKDMIIRGCAYVDLNVNKSKELLAVGREPPDRNKGVEEQLEGLDRMKENYFGEGQAVIRVKTDVRHPNPSIRDWIAFRIIDAEKHPHPIVGSKYFLWPTYNFAVSVDDHLLGITHVLRGKEHELNTEKQRYVYNCMGWNMPNYIHFGRLKLEGFIMSKSYIRKVMDERPGEFLGYDDPRFGTISGLRRRGILPESIKELIMEVGVKPGDAKISWTNLAAINRKKLDYMADRLMFVEDPVRFKLIQDNCLTATIPYHPDRRERTRSITVCDSDSLYINRQDASKKEFRLVGLGNYEVVEEGIKFINDSLEYARKKGLQIIQWVPEKDALGIDVLEPNGLKFIRHRGFVEGAIMAYTEGTKIQFIRFGFIIIDSLNPIRIFYIHK